MEEIKKELDALKEELKHASEAQMKGLNDKIIVLEAKLKEGDEKIKAIDLKAVNDGISELKKEVSDILAAMKLKEDDDKKNQTAFDNLQVSVKAIKTSTDGLAGKDKSFQDHMYDALNEGENFKNLEMMVTNHKDRKKIFSVEMKAVGDFSINTNYSGGSRALQVLRPGIVTNPNRRTHVRDIVPGGTIGQGTEFVFMYENGTGEGAISPVAEGSTKAQIDQDLAETSVKIETIAGWMRVTRKAMNNIPGFISYLQMRLPQRLLNIEDSQLLQGSGVTPNIKGIMTSGNYTAATSLENLLIEQLIDGLAQLEDTYERMASAILLRPLEYYRFFKTKSGGSKEYTLPKNVVFADGTLFISGVPCYQSTAVPANKYIVGDFAEGCQLLTQEGIRLEFFEQDGTNARENKITVRIEETIAFPVFGSTYFVVGDVGNSSLTS